MRAENAWEAFCDGNPGVIAGILLVLLAIGAGVWLYFALRPVPPKGAVTVETILARPAREARTETERDQQVTFDPADTVTDTIPRLQIPDPRTSHLVRPYVSDRARREARRA